jgi:hypothetical protein
MNVPPEGEDFKFAELAVFLRIEGDEWKQRKHTWPVDWLRKLARYPKENNTWFGGRVSIIANGEPPEPLGPGTQMTCWLLLGEKEPLVRANLPDGRSVVFYTMFPIHTDERDFEREHGTEALLKKFAKRKVSEYIDPDRESVITAKDRPKKK